MSADYFRACIQAQIDHARALSEKHGYSFRERTASANFSHGDFITAVLAIDDTDDARRFRDGYLEIMAADGVSPERAQELASANIGWCYGEGMAPERVVMWRATTGAVHPVFGSMVTPPTPEEALEAGRRLGESS